MSEHAIEFLRGWIGEKVHCQHSPVKIEKQAETLAYANPFMATDVRARLGAKLAELTPGDIDAFFFTNGGAEERVDISGS